MPMKTLIFYLGKETRDGFVMTISRQDERAEKDECFSFIIHCSVVTLGRDIISDGGPENQLEHGYLFVKGSETEYDTDGVHILKEEFNLAMELLLLYPDTKHIAQTRILL